MTKERHPMAAVDDALRQLQGEALKPRTGLTEEEKDALIEKLGGPKTARQVLRSQKEVPMARIPFLFSSLDSQAVVDVLANDMEAAIARAEAKRSRSPR